MTTHTFEQLEVWQQAHRLVLSIYAVTRKYPKEELFLLTGQIRRASISITANIAEGYKRIGEREKLRFYNISQGSLEETRNFIILSYDLGYISAAEKQLLDQQMASVSRLLNAYCRAIIQRIARKETPLTSSTPM